MSRFTTVLVLAIIVLGGLAAWFTMKGGAINTGGAYQAVFLTNSQVYFGKLTATGNTLHLRDVFYLSADNKLQAGTAPTASDLSLVKLGKELHGPTDEMNINREQVLFWESLKSDSKVVQAIQDYHSKNK